MAAELFREFLATLDIDSGGGQIPTTISLDFENGSSLSLALVGEDELSLVLLRPLLLYQSHEAMRIALCMCHFQEELPFPVRPALRGDTDLLFALHFSRSYVNMSNLARSVDLLREMDATLKGALP